MLIGETLHALQFDNKNILDKNVGKVLAHALALIIYGKRNLRNSPEPQGLSSCSKARS